MMACHDPVRRPSESPACRAFPGRHSVAAAGVAGSRGRAHLSGRTRGSRSSRPPASAGSTSSARATWTAAGSRSASSSTRSTTRTSSPATSARRSTSTTSTCSSCSHFPRYDKTVSRLNAAELDLFVGPDYLITLPNEPLQPVEYLFERCRTNEELREEYFSKGPGYLLYKIVDDCVDASFPMLRKIGNKLERIEQDIFEGRSAEIVRDISNAKQEIINFRKVIRPQRAAFSDLERNKQRYIADDLDIYFDDIVDASERVWDMLENYKEVVEALESTNETAIAHRSTETVRILTAFSVIFLPLTLIASIWGMNVKVPGEANRPAFFMVIAFMVVVLAGLLALFRRRGWL